MDVSVIICTYNPKLSYLERVFAGLRRQTLELDHFEVLLVDNNSDPPLESESKLEVPKNCRLVAEMAPGLTPARLRGIAEAAAELLIFVDDDAILNDDYLSCAIAISKSLPFVGVFGGNIELEFQSAPPEWTRPHWPRLAQRNVTQPIWSNFCGLPVTTPWGVGMCLRRSVALKYSSLVKDDPVRLGLDRNGSSLMSGGDDDMARTAHLLGMATGLFPELSLKHLIPPDRLEEDYLLRLVEAQSYSGIIVDSLHGVKNGSPIIGTVRQVAGRIKRRFTMLGRNRRFFEARLSGEQKALKDMAVAGHEESAHGNK